MAIPNNNSTETVTQCDLPSPFTFQNEMMPSIQLWGFLVAPAKGPMVWPEEGTDEGELAVDEARQLGGLDEN